MQHKPTTNLDCPQPNNPQISHYSSQHGFHQSGSAQAGEPMLHDSPMALPDSGIDGRGESSTGIGIQQLDERLLALSLTSSSASGKRPDALGQRISDYENAFSASVKHNLGFTVTKRSQNPGEGAQLGDFPNEILTHILSHLHPDSHAAVALVSKRFYSLVSEPHAWRMAFVRYFPGHSQLHFNSRKSAGNTIEDHTSDPIRPEARYFSRLTKLASWRSEYLLRTRLLRSLERGRPDGSSKNSAKPGTKSGKKAGAVVTYNTKLPWLASNIHAVFNNGNKAPRAIQGSSELAAVTVGDPTSGKIDKWASEDFIRFDQLEDLMPNLVPYGLASGPAACPNVMDVSQPHGFLAGEGFPGGRPYFRGVAEARGRYLFADTAVADKCLHIPKISTLSEGVSCVWLAKSSAVPAVTCSMTGMFTGSTLGVITSYALRLDISGPKYPNGEITARWIVSPGVPIISIQVDANYNVKRKSGGRIWAVALNALGEVYYLTETPTMSVDRSHDSDALKIAWENGATAEWHLIEETRRVAHDDGLGKDVPERLYCPHYPVKSMGLSDEQILANTREVEKYLNYTPADFRQLCTGWDMRQRLEVDFANDDGRGGGESVFIIDCGFGEDNPARIRRFMRTSNPIEPAETPTIPATPGSHSIFGTARPEFAAQTQPTSSNSTPLFDTPLIETEDSLTPRHNWYTATLQFNSNEKVKITTSTLDHSVHSTMTLGEDPLYTTDEASGVRTPVISQQQAKEIPGRRARFIAIGTDTGRVIVWNAREHAKRNLIQKFRVIQTESPEISSLGLTSLCVIHGGSDGLVQAWDVLASTKDPIRTINARFTGRVAQHMMIMNPSLASGSNYCAAGAMFLDPDPTMLRGVVSFGAFMRYWSYAVAGTSSGRKRRHRHMDAHGHLASKRQGRTSSREIAAEEAELRQEDERIAREQAHLRKRFGVGALGDLTEEEALRYAQMISEEAHEFEQRRASDSTGLDTASSFSEATFTTDTLTLDPSVVGNSSSVNDGSPSGTTFAATDHDNYEDQIQQAIRLSLMEGVNDNNNHSFDLEDSHAGYEFHVGYKTKKSQKTKASVPSTSSQWNSEHQNPPLYSSSSRLSSREDEELAIALSLSLQDQGPGQVERTTDDDGMNGFPSLDHLDTSGKGKGVMRW